MLDRVSRVLPLLLLLLASFGIAHGGILKVCECGPGNPYSCGICAMSEGGPAASGAASTDTPPCCCCDESGAKRKEGPDQPARSSVCPGMRKPRDVPGDGVQFESTPRVALHAAPFDLSGPVLPDAQAPRFGPALPDGPPWRLRPAGLGVLLV